MILSSLLSSLVCKLAGYVHKKKKKKRTLDRCQARVFRITYANRGNSVPNPPRSVLIPFWKDIACSIADMPD